MLYVIMIIIIIITVIRPNLINRNTHKGAEVLLMRKTHLALALLLLSAISLFIGVKDISPLDLFRLREDQVQILLVSRIPRLISIVIAGVSMGVVGLIMQQLSRNKFVSPTTGGTDDSALLGILVSLVLFSSATPIEKMLVAFVFALAGTFLFMAILDNLQDRAGGEGR